MSRYYEIKPKTPSFADSPLWFLYKPAQVGDNALARGRAAFLCELRDQGVETSSPVLHGAALFYDGLCKAEGRVLLDQRLPNTLARYAVAQYFLAKKAGKIVNDREIEAKFEAYRKWQAPGPEMHHPETGHFNVAYHEPAAQRIRAQASDEGRGMCTFEFFRTHRPDQNREALEVVTAFARFVRDIPSRTLGVPDFSIDLETFAATRPDLVKARAAEAKAELKAIDDARETFGAWVLRTGDVSFDNYEASLRGRESAEVELA